jgi:curved DNA-binding protein CbpA
MNPYSVLNIQPDAPEEVIEAAYKALIKKHHPDQGGDEDEFKKIQTAHEKITTDEATAGNSGFEDTDSLFGSLLYTPTGTETGTEWVIISSQYLNMKLQSVAYADISQYVYDWNTDDIEIDNRLIIKFQVNNRSDYVHQIKPKRIRAIGTDGRRYDAQSGTLAHTEESELPNRVNAFSREIEPGTVEEFASVVEPFPDDVYINKIIYPKKFFAGHNTDGIVQGKFRFIYNINNKNSDEIESIESKLQQDSKPDRIKMEDEKSSDEYDKDVIIAREVREELSDQEVSRLRYMARTGPTANSKLQSEWNMESGSEVYQYLKNNLDEYYYRDNNSMIRIKESALS